MSLNRRTRLGTVTVNDNVIAKIILRAVEKSDGKLLLSSERGRILGVASRVGVGAVSYTHLDVYKRQETALQAKLLKAIEEKQAVRLGGLEPIKFDVKIITAFNKEPLKCVRDGELRRDLFYRLSVVQLEIPPLRERTGDLQFLTDYFIDRYNESMGLEITGIERCIRDSLGRIPEEGEKFKCQWEDWTITAHKVKYHIVESATIERVKAVSYTHL